MTVHYISSIEYVAVNTIHGLKLFPANIRTHAYMRHFRTIFMSFLSEASPQQRNAVANTTAVVTRKVCYYLHVTS